MNRIKKAVTIEEVIDLLNEALTLDPEAINNLFNQEVVVNQTIAEHKTIQVGKNASGENRLRILGIINSIFGVDEKGYGALMMVTNENSKIIKFDRFQHPES